MEAGAIVALAWMERLTKVSRVRNWETVAHWPWLAARGGGFHCPPLSRVARRLWGELAQEGLWASYTFEWAHNLFSRIVEKRLWALNAVPMQALHPCVFLKKKINVNRRFFFFLNVNSARLPTLY
jgi:hypothetical protein